MLQLESEKIAQEHELTKERVMETLEALGKEVKMVQAEIQALSSIIPFIKMTNGITKKSILLPYIFR